MFENNFNPFFYSKVEHPTLSVWNIIKGMINGNHNCDHHNDHHNFFLAARYALSSLLHSSLQLKQEDHVLLPAYHCGSEIEVFYNFTEQVDYYSIDDNLYPNFTDILSKLRPNTRAILIIHYFGFIVPLTQLKELCLSKNIILIEDACHSLPTTLLNDREEKNRGNFILFSLKKFLPLSDGGFVGSSLDNNYNHNHNYNYSYKYKIANSRDLIGDLFTIAKNHYVLLATISPNIFLKSARLLQFFILLLIAKILKICFPPKNLFYLDREQFIPQALKYRCSSFSKNIFHDCDCEFIAKKRRENYFWLLRKIVVEKKLPIIPLKGKLEHLDAPMLFPFYFDCSSMRAEKVPKLFTWIHCFWNGKYNRKLAIGDMDGHQRENAGDYPVESKLYRHLFVIPIHQNINEQHLLLAIYELEQILKA